jgi:hypothetical protein
MLLGAALFGLSSLLGDSGTDRQARIVVTRDDVARIVVAWERQWGRPPSEEELSGLVASHIREEVLYREAVALRLDRDDTIVRRRLVQKLEFLTEDTALAKPPSEEEIAAFYRDHSIQFAEPARLTFSHVYVSTDRRGDAAPDDAAALLENLRAGADPAQLGDPFMLQRHFALRTEAELGQLFGREFASRLFALASEEWSGPIASGYGLHLVRIEQRQDGYQPELAAVYDAVRNEWLGQKRREANQEYYGRLRRRYAIEIQVPELQQRLADLTGQRGAS